ncbi:Crp/Fnr family transcriptional regulator [Clostridium niameyense]|uniref:Crp/Fnr family transcriptional regulator n=1 Tax=Clostridium niameyense TaxID=1622073 RepID=A0A6M0R9F6_9CLOT|nr:Crp/Fnr family transcriptional regulator [Clostridium niameyense]NEZ46290.1 Crp/Fnr family transcriptional regulator [Clostridium niameyense]
MDSKFLIEFLEKRNTRTITKKYHTYLTYYGLEQQYTYVLKKGIIKTSIILKNGREFNISYICVPDIISLLRDEVSNYTSSPFNVRVESEEAIFYKIPRVTFWQYVNNNLELQQYIKDYYRSKLSESIHNQQVMIMNSKKGAVCAFLYNLISKFGKKQKVGYLIDFPITNEDIAGFCGISTRNSVNRILSELKKEKIIDIVDQRIHILDIEYLFGFVLE